MTCPFLPAFWISSILLSAVLPANGQTAAKGPLRLAVAGITHGHVPWILGRKDQSDVTLVGIFEPDRQLGQQYAKGTVSPAELFFTDVNKMLDL